MKFIVHESISSILEEAQEEELTYIDRRTVATLSESLIQVTDALTSRLMRSATL